jgi:flagellar biosynthetic protein FliQ
MTPEMVTDISRQALWVTTLVAFPVLAVGLVVGLIVAILQAITQIQEMSIAFIPKLLVMVIVIAILMPWMLTTLTDYTRMLYQSIPASIGKL